MIATIPHIKGKDLSPDLLIQKKKRVNGVKLLIGYVENPS